MDDRARAILDEAREALERLADIKVERRDQSADYWSAAEAAPRLYGSRTSRPLPRSRCSVRGLDVIC